MLTVFAELPLGVIQQAVGVLGVGGDFKPAFDAENAFDVAHGYPLSSVGHGSGAWLKRQLAAL